MFDRLFKISVFGDKEVGKINLAKYINPRPFKNGSNSDLERSLFTIGQGFVSKLIETSGTRIRLSFYLFSDKERFKRLWDKYSKGTNGFILMYDITNANSLNYLSEVLQVLTNFREKFNRSILLVGNKLDLEEQREISKEQIEQFKEEYDITESIEISLKTGENVEQMLLQLTKMLLSFYMEDE
ncbi:MAG: Rab family GTPase [Promethearchaeota archaeon]